MLFNSSAFLLFLPIVLIVYYCLRHRAQNYWLLAASYFFYGCWDYRFLSLLLISTVVDYYVGQRMASESDLVRRKRLLMVSLGTNLGILGVFKYYGFFVESAASLLSTVGFQPHMPLLEIVLPVGISFYTFQTLSYTIDIYRKKLEPTKDFVTFALFVAYFPQLVAGPIERAKNLLPRLANKRVVSWPGIGIGVELILIGFLKKVGIADSIAPLIDTRFAFPGAASGAELLLCAYLFAFQIYCDFSGYSDIARGVSRLFGVKLMGNFAQPYFASNITDFWRRWHISLSSWLKDYLYISLGGNRHGKFKTYRNLMLTMLLGGLWHGANWTFVVWGGLHGIYLATHKYFSSFASAAPRSVVRTRISQVIGIFITFNLVTFTWIFFRSDNFSDALTFIMGIVDWQQNTGAFKELSWTSPKLLFSIFTLLAIDLLQIHRARDAVFLADNWALRRGLAYAGMVVFTLALGGLNADVPFIYFQF